MICRPISLLTVGALLLLAMGCKHLAADALESQLRDDEPLHVMSGHGDLISSLVFHPHEATQVLSGSWDGTVKLWDFSQGRVLWSSPLGQPVYVTALSHAGDSILVGGKDGLLVRLNMRDGTVMQTYQVASTRSVVQATFAQNDASFVVATHTGQLVLYDTETVTPQLDFATHAWPNIQMVGYSQDGRRIYSGDPLGIYIWDATTGRLLRTLRDTRHCTGERCRPWLTTAAFLPEQNYVIAGSLNEAIYFDVDSGQMYDLGVFISEVKDVGFSADGLHGFASSLDGTVMVWNMAEQTLVYSYENRNRNRFGTIVNADHSIAIAPDRTNHNLYVFHPDDHTDDINDRGGDGNFEARVAQISDSHYYVSLFNPRGTEPFHETDCRGVERAVDRTLVICGDSYDIQFVYLHDFSDAVLAFGGRGPDGEPLQFSLRCQRSDPGNGFLSCSQGLQD